ELTEGGSLLGGEARSLDEHRKARKETLVNHRRRGRQFLGDRRSGGPPHCVSVAIAFAVPVIITQLHFQYLTEAHRWWTEPDIRDVQVAVGSEGHSGGEEQSTHDDAALCAVPANPNYAARSWRGGRRFGSLQHIHPAPVIEG